MSPATPGPGVGGFFGQSFSSLLWYRVGGETEQLAFTPWNTGDGIRPTGPLMGLRQGAYRGSQEGRGLRDAQIP